MCIYNYKYTYVHVCMVSVHQCGFPLNQEDGVGTHGIEVVICPTWLLRI